MDVFGATSRMMTEECDATSHNVDGGGWRSHLYELILRKHQVDGTQLLIYIYIQCIYFAILSSE